MDSQRVAGTLATVIAVIVLGAVFFFGTKQKAAPDKPALPGAATPAQPKAPAKPGPVVRDLPLDQ